MGVDDDWSDVEPSAYRSRVPTLVFYGAAPGGAASRPPIEPVTRKLPVCEVSSSEIEDADIEEEVEPRTAHPVTAPPPPRPASLSLPRGSKLLIAALVARRAVQLGALVAVATLLYRPRQHDAPPVARLSAPTSAGLSAAPVAPCSLSGAARELAPRALISGGVELAPHGDTIAIGYAASPRDGMAVLLDAASLAVATRTKLLAAKTILRVVPAPRADASLDIAADAPDGERTFFDPVLGATYGLGGDGTREALRSAPLPGGAGYAVAFRRGGAIWLGVAAPDGHHALRSPPTHGPGLGPQIGSPAIAVVGDAVVLAWADRAKASDPWHVRWLTWRPGDAPGNPQTFAPPLGGLGAHAMSPSLAALGSRSFLLAWTEGPVARHQVRAQAMTLEGAALGPALAISEGTANAGQSQVAFASGGHGLVAFLAAKDNAFSVVGTPLACAATP